MANYRRDKSPGATYFFTVNLEDRSTDLLVRYFDVLSDAIRYVQTRHPIAIDAMVVLPEHIHAMWTMPENDDDYSTRWRLLKTEFTRKLPKIDASNASRVGKRERGIWQRRFWEHRIRDDRDFEAHVDYIHFNPIKHGHATRVRDWPYSSFHRWVREGRLPIDWAGELDLRKWQRRAGERN
ncbi:MAG: REP-associated tyrosine transposase [Casimicrobium sp.]